MLSRERQRRLFLVGAILLGLVFIGTLSAISVTQHRRLSAQANQYYASAQASLVPGDTYKDAKQWLEQNGFKVLYRSWVFDYSERRSDGQYDNYWAVRGSKVLGPSIFPPGDHWVSIVFVFKKEPLHDDAGIREYAGGDLLKIKLNDDSGPPPKSALNGY